MTEEERGHSKTLVYQEFAQLLRMNPDDLRQPRDRNCGWPYACCGGMLWDKISDRV
jgi:hypothetical protein